MSLSLLFIWITNTTSRLQTCQKPPQGAERCPGSWFTRQESHQAQPADPGQRRWRGSRRQGASRCQGARRQGRSWENRKGKRRLTPPNLDVFERMTDVVITESELAPCFLCPRASVKATETLFNPSNVLNPHCTHASRSCWSSCRRIRALLWGKPLLHKDTVIVRRITALNAFVNKPHNEKTWLSALAAAQPPVVW